MCRVRSSMTGRWYSAEKQWMICWRFWRNPERNRQMKGERI
ncbi:hypothetical protein CLOSTHATH_03586 [Hungatella hathewayi DSM 13479]|uniref:Uncharacterized protein n=1 Tax=Hungatella hathewayi DSM 13479 TaxID=566550 RepID=D3AIZ6_9FIRM|nr:hypothetical protein CLOSTHATH_03586 [Hungatella hathewayi DSM 13479]